MPDYVYHARCDCGEYMRNKSYNSRVRRFKMRCQFCKKSTEVMPSAFKIDAQTEGLVHLRHLNMNRFGEGIYKDGN